MHALIISLIASATPAPTFSDAVQTRLDDVAFTVNVISSSRAELRKINTDFAAGYEAESVRVQYKDPLRIKLTSKMNGQTLIYLINGDTQTFHVPRLGSKLGKQSENIAKKPGKRQTLLDFGLITPGMKQSFLDGTYVRTDRDGDYIFDVTYQYKGDKSRHRVWVDPQRKYVTQRMWYNQKGELMATFKYESPVQSNGVWFPSKLTVINAENKVAGTSQFSSIAVNSGIADSTFKL